MVIATIYFSLIEPDTSLVFAHNQKEEVVNKSPGDTFMVSITFKNRGETEGNWSINIAFEAESWSQVGTAQNLTLKPAKTRTLVWKGAVPDNAIADSMARLVVYYNDSFEPLDWWIHVVPGAELTIESSSVK